MNNRLALGLVCMVLALAIGMPMIRGQSYIIDGDLVTWENACGKLSVWPHTDYDLINHVQYANITSYLASQNIDFAFQFDFSITGRVYILNGDWVDVTPYFEHNIYENKHYYWIKDIYFEQDEMKQVKWEYQTPINTSGKWELYIKKSSDTLAEALASGNYMNIDPWWNASWGYKIPIEVNQTGSTTLHNFPVWFQFNISNLTQNGLLDSDGNCLRFMNGSETASLDWEYEDYYDPAFGLNGTNLTQFWIEIDELPSSNTTIYMYYDGFCNNANSDNDTLGTWNDGYRGVYHLYEDTILGGWANDSTGQNQLNYTNGVNQSDISRFGHASYFDGEVGSNAIGEPANLSSGFTIETWVYFNVINSTHRITGLPNQIEDLSESNGDGVSFEYATAAYNDIRLLICENGNYSSTTPKYVLSDGEWYYIAATYNATTQIARLYINGSQVAINYSIPFLQGDTNFSIGAWSYQDFGSEGHHMMGTLDEVRISNITRSTDWILRSYEQHLISFGVEEHQTTPLVIDNIESPVNTSYLTGEIDYNVTLGGGTPPYIVNISVDGEVNMTTTNDSAIHFYNLSNHHPNLQVGQHNITFYVFDDDGSSTQQTVYFRVSLSNFYIYEEMTGNVYNMSIPNETILTIFCADSANTSIITEYTGNLSLDCEIELVRVNMDFGSNIGQFFRPLIPHITDTSLLFFMPNPLNDTVLTINLKLIDFTGNFGDDGIVRVTKIINDSSREIIEQEIGLGSYLVLYLIKDQRYDVDVRSLDGTITRVLNEIIPVASGTLDVTIGFINSMLNQSLFSENIFWSAALDEDAQQIDLVYYDLLSNTINATFEIFNGSNISQLLFSETTTSSTWQTMYNNIPENHSFRVKLTIYHNDFDGPQIEIRTIGYYIGLFDDFPVSQTTLSIIGIAFLSIFALLFSPRYASVGAIGLATVTALFTFVFGIFEASVFTYIFLALMFMIAVIGKLTNRGLKV